MPYKYYSLTEREKEVLFYLKDGLTNKEIAGIIHVTHHTVKAHVSAIIKKLGCKNRTGAALYAQEHNISIHLPNSIQP